MPPNTILMKGENKSLVYENKKIVCSLLQLIHIHVKNRWWFKIEIMIRSTFNRVEHM